MPTFALCRYFPPAWCGLHSTTDYERETSRVTNPSEASNYGFTAVGHFTVSFAIWGSPSIRISLDFYAEPSLETDDSGFSPSMATLAISPQKKQDGLDSPSKASITFIPTSQAIVI